jgi:glycosyltransferase involved in cell wall biosynthesis
MAFLLAVALRQAVHESFSPLKSELIMDYSRLRIAFLYPTVELGAYWQPVLAAFIQQFKNTMFYTGRLWPGFDPQMPGASVIRVVGQTQFVEVSQKAGAGYGRGYYAVSPRVVIDLLRFRPQVIFTSAFSVWTIFALLLKGLGRWRVVIMWDGSSPNVDFRDAKLRLMLRRGMARFTEAFITNSHGGKNYLVNTIGVAPDRVFVKPYMVPDVKALSQKVGVLRSEMQQDGLVFLYVGRIESRKGLHLLLEACAILQQQGYTNYKLQIIGTGEQQDELEAFVQQQGLGKAIAWLGWVDYGNLGEFFAAADVFVFPSLEDIWGMVVLEAMAFGKPILCSQWAGASELVEAGENGYVFDPHQPDQLTKIMQMLMDHPEKVPLMGQKSQALMRHHTPQDAAQIFADMTAHVLMQ